MSGFRIWSTADGRYVGDGHLDAAFLAAGPADKAPDDFDPETFQSADGTYPLRAAVEADVEPTEPTEEADAEPTEPTEEADAEPTEEADAEPTEEADAEPTEEAGDEPTEPTEEADAEPTEPTEEAAAASKRRGK